MDIKELSQIKYYQREFKEMFDKPLEVDWNKMNNVTRFTIRDKINPIKDLLEECLEKYEADLDLIVTPNIRLYKTLSKERDAMHEFSKYVIDNHLNVSEAARLINKDRKTIYSYAGINYYVTKNQRKTKRKK